jgi:hypothetical protein
MISASNVLSTAQSAHNADIRSFVGSTTGADEAHASNSDGNGRPTVFAFVKVGWLLIRRLFAVSAVTACLHYQFNDC